MARPQTERPRRQKLLQVCINDREKEKLTEYAESLGVTASEVIRDFIKSLSVGS